MLEHFLDMLSQSNTCFSKHLSFCRKSQRKMLNRNLYSDAWYVPAIFFNIGQQTASSVKTQFLKKEKFTKLSYNSLKFMPGWVTEVSLYNAHTSKTRPCPHFKCRNSLFDIAVHLKFPLKRRNSNGLVLIENGQLYELFENLTLEKVTKTYFSVFCRFLGR